MNLPYGHDFVAITWRPNAAEWEAWTSECECGWESPPLSEKGAEAAHEAHAAEVAGCE